MTRLLRFAALLAVWVAVSAGSLNAQQYTYTGANVITTGVPFLTIAPDSRAAGLGDAGVATSPDVNAQHWNPEIGRASCRERV